MKKVIIFLVIIVGIFAALFFITNAQKNEALKDNPYKKKDLKQVTIDQLDDPNYQYLILPDELEKKLENKESVTVYFYKPDCPHCRKQTPVVVSLAKEKGINVVQYNLLEFEAGWDLYGVHATPTLVHFENGEKKAEIIGGYYVNDFEAGKPIEYDKENVEKNYETFFDQYVLDK